MQHLGAQTAAIRAPAGVSTSRPAPYSVRENLVGISNAIDQQHELISILADRLSEIRQIPSEKELATPVRAPSGINMVDWTASLEDRLRDHNRRLQDLIDNLCL